MNKVFIIVLLLLGGSITSMYASTDYDGHFVTKDGRHMCGEWMQRDTYRLCEEVGIIYDRSGDVISGEKPFFDDNEDGIIVVGSEKFCVQDGVESLQLSECDGTIHRSNNQGSFVCTTKDGVETCNEESSSSIGTQVLNNSTCTLNGESVDCSQIAETAKSWFKAGVWMLLIGGILFLVITIIWIWTLIHALSHPIPNKVLWVLVIFFLGIIGSVIYYFVIMRKYTTVMVPNPNNPPYQMNVGVTYTEGPVPMQPQSPVTAQYSQPVQNPAPVQNPNTPL